jgi:hypothetical protein
MEILLDLSDNCIWPVITCRYSAATRPQLLATKSYNLKIAHITLSTNQDALASADLTTCSNLPPRSESIPALLPDQLDYIDLLISDESTQPTPRQHVPSKSASSISMFHKELQELEPCNPEWNPPNSSGALFASLEDEMLSADDSPMHR